MTAMFILQIFEILLEIPRRIISPFGSALLEIQLKNLYPDITTTGIYLNFPALPIHKIKEWEFQKKKLLSFFSSTILTLDIIIYFKYMKIPTNCIILLFKMHTKIFPEMEKLLYMINQSPKMIQLCLVCRKKNGKVKILWIVFLMTRMKNVI